MGKADDGWDRLIKQALEARKPVLMLSIGPSRADGLPGVEKIEMKAGTVLEGVLERYIAYVLSCTIVGWVLICRLGQSRVRWLRRSRR
jgi:hypothetical protein